MNLLVILGILLDGTIDAATSGAFLAKFSAGFGAGIVVLAAAMGIGKIGKAAMEAIARQPEAASDIRSNMIVAAALIEGVAFFALVVTFLILFV